MKLPTEWITEFAPVGLGPEEIAASLTMAGLEVEASSESDLGTVLDIKVTPNRGDCLSVLGVARELAAACGRPFAGPRACRSSEDEPPDVAMYTGVTVDDPALCPRYAARVVQDVRLAESPQWMRDRLIAAGMRPISNIVDITNYVMIETGQPLHAFDYETLHERRIVVRRARSRETLRTLDGAERTLPGETLVIADADRAVAIAGVMGGAETEITSATRTLLLESAHFDWRSIRRTARALGLVTEASYRFERGVDPEGVVYAADLACQLISDLGVGVPVPGVVDEYPVRRGQLTLPLRPARCAALMGYARSTDEIIEALLALGFEVSPDGSGALTVRVPLRRPDIQRETDLVEEVARVLGYDRIPERLPRGATIQGGVSAEDAFRDRVRDCLVGAGLQEVVTHTLREETALDDVAGSLRIPIRNALSGELSGLRRSLLPGIVETVERNARRGEGPLALFEVGAVFSATSESEHVERDSVAAVIAGPLTAASWHGAGQRPEAFYVGKGLIEHLLKALHMEGEFRGSDDGRFHPARQATVTSGGQPLGIVGELHPDLAAQLHVRDRCVAFELDLTPLRSADRAASAYTPLTHYPMVQRDLAPRVSREIPYDRIRRIVAEASGEMLNRLSLTDVYSGPPLPDGIRSLTLSLSFRASDRTLIDVEVDGVLESVRSRLIAEVGATFQEA